MGADDVLADLVGEVAQESRGEGVRGRFSVGVRVLGLPVRVCALVRAFKGGRLAVDADLLDVVVCGGGADLAVAEGSGC